MLNTGDHGTTNAPKTKVTSTQPRPGTHHTIHLGGVLLEVESFKYLGSSFTATGQAKDKISGLIGRPRSAFARLNSTLWSRREISIKTRVCIYEALIRTISLYGCETWRVQAEDLRRLAVFGNDCLGCLFRCCRRDRVLCASLRHRCRLCALPSVLLQRRLRGFGLASTWAPGEII